MDATQLTILWVTLIVWLGCGIGGSYYWLKMAKSLNLGWWILVDVVVALIMVFAGGLAWLVLAYEMEK